MTVKAQKTDGNNVAMKASKSDEEESIGGRMKNLGILHDALATSTADISKFRLQLKKKSDESHVDVEQLIEKVVERGGDFDGLGTFADELIDEKLAYLYKKTAWKPGKIVKNFGYIGYEDMLLRYRDLKRNLETLKKLNARMVKAHGHLSHEYRNLRQIGEKVDELRYRSNLMTVAGIMTSRVTPGDPCSRFCDIPAILCSIIFLPETSDYYATILLRICKQILVILEASQYEKDKRNRPIVTMSNLLTHPTIKSAVSSLFVPVAEGNGEVGAPEDYSPLVAHDSSQTLMVAENGEVIAPTDLCLPVAKDSSMTVNSKELPKPLSTAELRDSCRGKVKMPKNENVELNQK